MKFIRFMLFLAVFVPCASFGADTSGFQNAASLLKAARNGDVQTVQRLINSGADVNFVDSTGLSLVCTAVMNNDKRAIQILQMYGADASKCDRQIKQYKEKTRTAAKGTEYGFFSGLSSSHILALSAVGVAAVVGGVALLTDVFDSDNDNGNPSGGGSHGGDDSGGGSNVAKSFTIPYGPAYLTPTGALDTSFDISENLASWDTNSASELRRSDFNYLRQILTVNSAATSQAMLDGINPLLENYLLTMHGYYSLASGYMGQNIFRDDSSKAPLLPAIADAQGRPVRVALITGNGINPAGSADSSSTITYAIGTSSSSATPTVDKYLNNALYSGVPSEESGFDLSGSGSAFNPFANPNDSALAKIVGGWENGRSSDVGDLMGFVPNAQLAIYRTGNGVVWENATGPQTNVGVFSDEDTSGGLSVNDTITLGSDVYTVKNAVDVASAEGTIQIGSTTYKVASNSKMFIAQKCVSVTECTNIGIYVGADGNWYVNSTGSYNVDAVYAVDSTKNIYIKKVQNTGAAYTNFEVITNAVGKTYTVSGEPSVTGVDVIANTNVIPGSRDISYLSVKNFTKAANMANVSDLKTYYSSVVNSYYGSGQGGVANSLFLNYNSSKPMLIMPAGDYLFKQENGDNDIYYYDTLDATFENYAPAVYGATLNHNFMTVVAVSHEKGTSAASTISGYGDGINSAYGKIRLSLWYDGTDPTASNVYASRKCGVAGSGTSGVDPWCFAATGPTAEMATASMAGAVASVKSAFSYMTNDQVFTLLALTADGPYLAANTSGTVFSTDTLVEHLKDMYVLPLEYNESTLSSSAYLSAFKDVFGYGLVNLERATKPGFSVYYYDGTINNIVSSTGAANKFWGNVSTTTSRASSAFALTGRGAITTSFYDVLQSTDGSLSLPRVWKTTFATDMGDKHGLYMGDVLGDFRINESDKQMKKVGDFEFSMSMSPRAYNDNLNGLDDLRVAFVGRDFDIAAEYQHYLTDGESRFNGRANAVLGLASNAILSDAVYKMGKFNFGARAFSGTITDESLLENDPVVSAQYEPGRLGLVDGGAFNVGYNGERFGLNLSVGLLHENNTVLGSYSDGLLALNGADTKYVDMVATYKPMENLNLFARGTIANTDANCAGGLITELSNITSDAFALGVDIGGFGFTVAMPLAVVDGKMGYGYADFDVVGDNGHYEIAVNNAHTEYINLAPEKRELRFTTSYKHAFSETSKAGIEYMYRLNPYNTDAFGNESVFMFKIQHKLGI